MPARLLVVGTYDQPEASLFDVDLMRYLAGAGVPACGIVFKRSAVDANPRAPVMRGPDALGRVTIHAGDFNDAAVVSCIAGLAPDLLVYAGGRDLLRAPLLRAAAHGCLGGHYGRLPRIRGMATVEWSVIVGEAPTVAIQRINPGIDTGDVVMQARVPLLPHDTFASIRDRSYFMTKVMLAAAAKRVLLDGVTGTPQAIGEGRQFYRLHPELQAYADRSLGGLLTAMDRQAARP